MQIPFIKESMAQSQTTELPAQADRPAHAGEPTLPKRRGRQSRFTEKQGDIIQAATEILNERGLKGITLAAVAEKTELIVQGVGYYFPKKDDLAAACILAAIARYQELVDTALEQRTAEARVRALIGEYFELLSLARSGEGPAIAVLNDIRALNPANLKRVLAALGILFRRLRTLYEAPGLDWLSHEERGVRAVLLLQMILSVPLWTQNAVAEDYTRGRDRMLDILLNGLAARRSPRWKPQALAQGATDDETIVDTYLVAAARLINEEGYKGASVEKIAARLNVSKGAFYYHNDAKNDVVMRCFDRTFDLIARAQVSAGNLAGTELERLIAASEALVRMQYTDTGPLLRSSALSALPSEMKLEMITKWSRVADRFAAMISDGFVDGSIRPTDARIGAYMLMAAINSASELQMWFRTLDPADMGRLYVRPLFNGLLAR